mmetsp:Transcript_71504/g.205121  ORF Transcript_71504/g.205121 Transcript_71504/m.205121 type:complete len:201 (+) Transcript_71504:46-648(+)
MRALLKRALDATAWGLFRRHSCNRTRWRWDCQRAAPLIGLLALVEELLKPVNRRGAVALADDILEVLHRVVSTRRCQPRQHRLRPQRLEAPLRDEERDLPQIRQLLRRPRRHAWRQHDVASRPCLRHRARERAREQACRRGCRAGHTWAHWQEAAGAHRSEHRGGDHRLCCRRDPGGKLQRPDLGQRRGVRRPGVPAVRG